MFLVGAIIVGTLGAVPAGALVRRDIEPTSASPARPSAAPSVAAQAVAAWVRASNDNGALPFMIVDKVNARLFLFDSDGVLRTMTSVLLGLARGDDSPAGIGTRKLSAITPAERITPAGRFVVEAGRNLAGQDILWIDYDAAIALHRASDRTPHSGGRSRVERLASATVADRRISLGCINVSAAFYDGYIAPTFSHTKGVAYILPETRSTTAEFDMPASAAERTAVGL